MSFVTTSPTAIGHPTLFGTATLAPSAYPQQAFYQPQTVSVLNQQQPFTVLNQQQPVTILNQQQPVTVLHQQQQPVTVLHQQLPVAHTAFGAGSVASRFFVGGDHGIQSHVSESAR
jgi:hypothetical protein